MSAVALITDLFFISKVQGTAEMLGVPLRVVRTADNLDGAITPDTRMVIIDLNATGTDPLEAIRLVKERPSPPTTIAFLSHVQKDLAAAASEAGVDQVLPRSRFSAELHTLLGALR